MDQLATFLGHDIRVHREFYQLPESTLQLAKVSKLLIAMEKGKLSDLQGKGLDDITINPDGEFFFLFFKKNIVSFEYNICECSADSNINILS